jgi:hypothetical protein
MGWVKKKEAAVRYGLSFLQIQYACSKRVVLMRRGFGGMHTATSPDLIHKHGGGAWASRSTEGSEVPPPYTSS